MNYPSCGLPRQMCRSLRRVRGTLAPSSQPIPCPFGYIRMPEPRQNQILSYPTPSASLATTSMKNSLHQTSLLTSDFRLQLAMQFPQNTERVIQTFGIFHSSQLLSLCLIAELSFKPPLHEECPQLHRVTRELGL